MESLLHAIEVETGEAPTYAVIWLHGLGADGSDFVPVVHELGLSDRHGVRFVFPHAPFIPVTCNGGYVMRAWYDIISLEPTSRRVDEMGVVRSREAVRGLIAHENQRGIPCSRVFLAGFSQGGAVAYATALTHPEALAGVVGLSTYIPTPGLIADEASDANRKIPVLAAHGVEDDVVSLELGMRARNLLLQHGCQVEWHEYRMTHTLCPEEIEAIGKWLLGRMA